MNINTAAYLKDPTRCPRCKSSEIEGHTVTTGGGTGEQEMGCNACHLTWIDYYSLKSITWQEELF